MGLFNLFAGVDINKGVEECRATEGAVLIDVRGADEYRQGHIPGAINIPLDGVNRVLVEYRVSKEGYASVRALPEWRS